MMAASSFVPPTMILDLAFLAMLVVVAFAIVRLRSLFAIVMLQGVYSLVSAAWFVSLDAVDVAFTEAAVGAGVSTVLMLSAMLLADRKSNPVPVSKQLLRHLLQRRGKGRALAQYLETLSRLRSRAERLATLRPLRLLLNQKPLPCQRLKLCLPPKSGDVLRGQKISPKRRGKE